MQQVQLGLVGYIFREVLISWTIPREEWTMREKETLNLGPDMVHCFISAVPSAIVEEGE